MGSAQTTTNHRKRYRLPVSTKAKRADRFRTTIRSVTLRALAARNSHNSVSSSNGSTINNSSFTSPNTLTTLNSQADSDSYLSDFDYRKLSTLTGLSESKINELHREFLILSDHGRLSYERYRSMLESVPVRRTDEPIEKLARRTFTSFDKDGNNYLDFAEFIAAYITMENNELCLYDKPTLYTERPISSVSPTITSLTRQATAYYSPPPTLINTSSMMSPRPTYHLPNNYASYQPQSPDQYVYVSSQRLCK